MRLKKHLRNHSGDMYIQMLICMLVFLITSVIVFTLASSMTDKLWLDEKLEDIANLVSSTGRVDTESVQRVSKQITDRFGGEIYFEGTFLDEDKTRVQLNDQVYVCYHHDEYTIMSIFGVDISTEINLSNMAISGVYFKTTDPLVDPIDALH